MKLATLLLISILALETSAAVIDKDFMNKLSDGGRKGLHGMVLFGNGPYYMAHIPMLNMPHDVQIVSEVSLQDSQGEKISFDFSKQTWTIKPQGLFSLNGLIKGSVSSYRASVFKGSFEQGGTVVQSLKDITVLVGKHLVVRPLPSKSKVPFIALDDHQGNEFLVNIISPENNFQAVKNKGQGENIWCVLGPDFFEFCD